VAGVTDPDDEITQVIPQETLGEVAANWAEKWANLTSSERPTKNIRVVKKDDHE
jgi:hypothetical protein